MHAMDAFLRSVAFELSGVTPRAVHRRTTSSPPPPAPPPNACFVCHQPVAYLEGVWQVSGCEMHANPTVAESLGDLSHKRLVHTGACHDAYVAMLRTKQIECPDCAQAKATAVKYPPPPYASNGGHPQIAHYV
jgi:hypothetical protein